MGDLLHAGQPLPHLLFAGVVPGGITGDEVCGTSGSIMGEIMTLLDVHQHK